jgi:hypothetical protein
MIEDFMMDLFKKPNVHCGTFVNVSLPHIPSYEDIGRDGRDHNAVRYVSSSEELPLQSLKMRRLAGT